MSLRLKSIAIAIATCALLAGLVSLHIHHHAGQNADWPAYGGPTGDRFSPLTQITRQNVRQLKPVWTFNPGEPGGLQTNPLIVDRTLFGFTPTQRVIALDAATGKLLWSFSSGTPGGQPTRGLTFWSDGTHGTLFAGLSTFLYALDPATGKPISSFGQGGRIDLRADLDAPNLEQSFAAMTTPGVLYKDTLIVGFRAPETKPAVHGDIRAYDVRTGKLRWIFHTIPHPGEDGYSTWPKDAWKSTGAANNWAGMAVDTARGIVYAPTGSAVDDFYGGDRVGNDRFANTLLALDANTGKRLWDFQGVHHDIWDRDFPSPPSLVTVTVAGKPVDAVAQTTKQGFLYLFDRASGSPIFPVKELPFPASTVPGEHASPTQPVPQGPEPFARQQLTEALLTERTPEAHAFALKAFRAFQSAGQFLPLSLDQQTVVFPGFDGGAEWGGSAVDHRTGVLYVNANDIAWTGGLTRNQPTSSPGATAYLSQCATCHGGDRRGAPPAFPSLVEVDHRLSDNEITAVIHNGKGRMPALPNVAGTELTALLDFLKSGGDLAPSPTAVSPDRSETRGAALYAESCALCHGPNLTGASALYPAIVGVRSRLPDAQILSTIHNGKGRMPAFPHLASADTAALLRFLGKPAPPARSQPAPRRIVSEITSKHEAASGAPTTGASPYRFTGYRKFLDPDGYPAVAPPWGTLNAIDLNTGRYLWKIPLGNYPELAAQGLKDTGSENYGGPVVTASGLVFIGATIYDHTLRCFDSQTGTLLWSADLPFAGNATPATYMVDGRQYLVIATSNARNPKQPQGAAYVAFALP